MRHFSGRPDGPTRQHSLDHDDEAEPPAASGSSHGVDNNNRNDSNDNNQSPEGGEQEEEEEEDEEDDYMNMTFTDVAPAHPETSLQRRQRLRKEGLSRGRVPSKAELAARERERREEGLSRPLIPGTAAAGAPAAAARRSKGLAMMARMGFRPGSALGSGGGAGGAGGAGGPAARSEPLRIQVKEDRGGIGADAERKRKVLEAAGAAAGPAKRARVVEEVGDYRERMARERQAARDERLVLAAQKIAEMMDEEQGGALAATEAAGDHEEEGGEGVEEEKKRKSRKGSGGKGGNTPASRPLRSVPVLYRGLVRQREERERDRRMRYDLEQSSGGLSAKLPTYDDDDVMDNDDRIALGRTEKKTAYMPADDLDEEDPELDDFNVLGAGERLRSILKYLRGKYRYCFWCKCAYPDEEMEGCPGLTEEDHD